MGMISIPVHCKDLWAQVFGDMAGGSTEGKSVTPRVGATSSNANYGRESPHTHPSGKVTWIKHCTGQPAMLLTQDIIVHGIGLLFTKPSVPCTAC